MKIVYFLSIFLGLSGVAGHSQVSVSTDGSLPHASAMLDVKSTTKGLLIPRMSTTERLSVSSPAEGLIVFDTDLGSLAYYTSGTWKLTPGTPGGVANEVTFWNTSSALGSNSNLVWDNANSRLGIGTTAPTQQLELTASLKLPETTNSATGIIYKGEYPFIHDYSPPGADGANVFMGWLSGNFTMVGTGNQSSFNTGVGYYSLWGLTTGCSNTGLGSFALQSNNTGVFNSAVGTNALLENTSGGFNAAFGCNALSHNTVGNYNVALGDNSLSGNTASDRNTAAGYSALFSQSYYPGANYSGNNVAIGFQSLYNLASTSVDNGKGNTAVGSSAMYNATTGYHNTGIGYNADINPTDQHNSIAIGYNTIATASDQVRLGDNNIASLFCTGAYNATTSSPPNLVTNPTGQIMRSTAAVPSGSGNPTQVAFWSSTSELSSSSNLVWDNTNFRLGIGTTAPAGQLHIQSNADALLLVKADADNVNDEDNPRIELKQDGTSVTGALGYEGLANATYSGTAANDLYMVNEYTGSGLAFGTSSTVRMVVSSAGNVGIHESTPDYPLQVNGVIAPSTTGANLGTSTLRWDLYGNDIFANAGVMLTGIGTGTGTTLVIDGSGNVLKQTSSSRYKTDIEDLEVNTENVYALEPVSFTWKDQGTRDFGLKAEDVAETLPELVNFDQAGEPESVKYAQLSVLLLVELKKQKEEIESLKRKIEALENK